MSRSRRCAVSGCYSRPEYRNLFCQVHWRKLPQPHRMRLMSLWEHARRGDEGAKRCAGAAKRAALNVLHQEEMFT